MSSFFAPAKINLALHVTGRRVDGYHLLETLAVFTRFGDSLRAAPSTQDSFEASGRYGRAVPAHDDNLVLKARDRFREAYPGGGPLAIVLEKNLPPASGMGGGSSDAAAILRALRARTMPAPTSLAEMAVSLGADVPMCLVGQPLIARGIGEKIETLEGFPALAMVLVNPGLEVSTPAVFRALPKSDNGGLPSLPPRDPKHLLAWLGETRNDLEGPACGIAPSIKDALQAIRAEGALFARMSGSGATCFGIFRDDDAAREAADALRRAHPSWFVVATRSMASSEDLEETDGDR